MGLTFKEIMTECAKSCLNYQHAIDHSRLIIEATYPAPNPLSMLTTLTFEAQEFSMPSRAASPLKEAP
jgi:hypothetical protein